MSLRKQIAYSGSMAGTEKPSRPNVYGKTNRKTRMLALTLPVFGLASSLANRSSFAKERERGMAVAVRWGRPMSQRSRKQKLTPPSVP